MDKQIVFDFLDKHKIAYKKYFHEATVSVEDSKRIIDIPDALGCKSLLVKDKKSDRYFLAVIPSDKRADMRGLAKYVGAEKFEFASAEKLLEFFDVTRGNVSPFCFLCPSSKSVGLLIDKKLTEVGQVRFHPCDNTATVSLTNQDFFVCMKILDKKAIITE
ncbi:MAG TPA: YbaK/EbsC family protein [Clostridia bacterium]|nr:YbaK/EbsC family protein [Clostridia bacterium]